MTLLHRVLFNFREDYLLYSKGLKPQMFLAVGTL